MKIVIMLMYLSRLEILASNVNHAITLIMPTYEYLKAIYIKEI